MNAPDIEWSPLSSIDINSLASLKSWSLDAGIDSNATCTCTSFLFPSLLWLLTTFLTVQTTINEDLLFDFEIRNSHMERAVVGIHLYLPRLARHFIVSWNRHINFLEHSFHGTRREEEDAYLSVSFCGLNFRDKTWRADTYCMVHWSSIPKYFFPISFFLSRFSTQHSSYLSIMA